MAVQTVSPQENAKKYPRKIVDSLAIVSLVGFSCFVLSTIILHWLQPDLDPLNKAVSYYVHGFGGWLLTAGLLSLGFGSLSLTACLGFFLDGAVKKTGWWLLGIWSISILLCGFFPTDPPGNWGSPPSTAGMLHNSFALVAFLSLPISALLMTRTFRFHSGWNLSITMLRLISFATVISFILFMASLLPVMISPGPPMLLGLTERILLAIYVIWLGMMALGLRKQISTTNTVVA